MARIDASTLDLKEHVVAINRVSKTVKGGRIFKFAALVVVGDGNGIVGFGIGKSGEVPDSIRKGIEDAKKNLMRVSMRGTTIPHEVIGAYDARPCFDENQLLLVLVLSLADLFVRLLKQQALKILEQKLCVLIILAT